MILLIDNYDSFVYNLARYLQELGQQTYVVRNDKITLNEIAQLQPSHIVLSPGPCTPNEAGISLAVVKQFAGHIPLLGVCLGHQVIAQAYGAQIIRAQRPYHGKASLIYHNNSSLFNHLPNPLIVGRYHSLIIDQKTLATELQISACTVDNEIMALQHYQHPVYGVQFHPESVLTKGGYTLLKNFLAAR